MNKWEYRVIPGIAIKNTVDMIKYQNLLEQAGSEGWEVCGTQTCSDDGQWVVLLKRPTISDITASKSENEYNDLWLGEIGRGRERLHNVDWLDEVMKGS